VPESKLHEVKKSGRLLFVSVCPFVFGFESAILSTSMCEVPWVCIFIYVFIFEFIFACVSVI